MEVLLSIKPNIAGGGSPHVMLLYSLYLLLPTIETSSTVRDHRSDELCATAVMRFLPCCLFLPLDWMFSYQCERNVQVAFKSGWSCCIFPDPLHPEQSTAQGLWQPFTPGIKILTLHSLLSFSGEGPHPVRDPLPSSVWAGANLSSTCVQLPHGVPTKWTWHRHRHRWYVCVHN